MAKGYSYTYIGLYLRVSPFLQILATAWHGSYARSFCVRFRRIATSLHGVGIVLFASIVDQGATGRQPSASRPGADYRRRAPDYHGLGVLFRGPKHVHAVFYLGPQHSYPHLYQVRRVLVTIPTCASGNKVSSHCLIPSESEQQLSTNWGLRGDSRYRDKTRTSPSWSKTISRRFTFKAWSTIVLLTWHPIYAFDVPGAGGETPAGADL